MVNQIIAKNIIRLKQVDSTNNYAAMLISTTNVVEGTVIIADYQKNGKGQRGNVWSSECGKNLTMSIVLYPSFLSASTQFYLSKAIAISICQGLRELTGKEQFKIKWPNDILLNNNKVAGVLIENNLKGKCLASSVVGVGININQTNFTGIEGATSLLNECGSYNVNEVLSVISTKIDSNYLLLKNEQLETINLNYFNLLFGFREKKKYQSNNLEIFDGTITGVTDEGLIEIICDNRIRRFNMKEISFLI